MKTGLPLDTTGRTIGAKNIDPARANPCYA